MISLINGTIRAISSDKIVVEVGGVGLAISVTSTTASQLNLGNQIQLFTTLVVREDSLTLFGFLDDQMRLAFELVQTVSGIGPKVALSMMSSLSPQALAVAIAQEDIKVLEKVPGIGRKGAQRLILELKGKISDFGTGQGTTIHQPIWREQLLNALISLGFTAKDSDAAITEVVANNAQTGVDAGSLELSELLKQALASGRRA